MDIPPEVAIKSTIRIGSVYYFTEESLQSDEPHYFIVINKNPHDDKIVFLVCAQSQIAKVKQRRKNLPPETLVEINPKQYPGFKKDSIIDCNSVWEKSVDQLADKLAREELKLKPEMDVSLVKRLRVGTLRSPSIDHRIKALLQD
jgi:hypothetical protein